LKEDDDKSNNIIKSIEDMVEGDNGSEGDEGAKLKINSRSFFSCFMRKKTA
jgi:hypothetical protein